MVAADRAALTRLRRLVSSLIATEPFLNCIHAQVKLVCAEMSLVLVYDAFSCRQVKPISGWAWF